MTSREDHILKSRDPSVEDENEWEEFSLTDVKVLIPGKSRYANLLDASPDNPVRVVGSLNEVEDEQGYLGMTFFFCFWSLCTSYFPAEGYCATTMALLPPRILYHHHSSSLKLMLCFLLNST